MFSLKKATGSLLLLAMIVLVGACQPKTPAVPTLDAQAIYTAAAQTVQAELTQSALLTPKATNTLEPTATFTQIIPTLAPIGSADGGAATGTPVVVITLAQVPGAATATLAPQAGVTSGDKAEIVSNDPPDGATILPKTDFDISWTIKNVGTTTWNKNYTWRFFAGRPFGTAKTTYNFPAEVKPGATVKLIMDSFSPETPGSYLTWWKLTNDQGINFGDVSTTLEVVTVLPTAKP